MGALSYLGDTGIKATNLGAVTDGSVGSTSLPEHWKGTLVGYPTVVHWHAGGIGSQVLRGHSILGAVPGLDSRVQGRNRAGSDAWWSEFGNRNP